MRNRVLALDPNAAVVYGRRGNAYSAKGDYDHAISDYDQAIRLGLPKLALAYQGRASAYFRKGDYDRTIADYDQALKIDPSLADARQARERLQVLLATRSNPGAQANATASTAVPVTIAPSGHRIALVIGMSAYANVEPLRNPASDAAASPTRFAASDLPR